MSPNPRENDGMLYLPDKCSFDHFIPLLAVLSWCGVKGTLCTVGRNVSWFSNYGKQDGGFPVFPYDLAIPLLGIYPNKTVIQKDMCTLIMFIATLFTIVKT